MATFWLTDRALFSCDRPPATTQPYRLRFYAPLTRCVVESDDPEDDAWQCPQPVTLEPWQRHKSAQWGSRQKSCETKDWYRQKSGSSAAASTAVPPAVHGDPASEPTSDNLASWHSDASEETEMVPAPPAEYYRVRNTFVEQVDSGSEEEASGFRARSMPPAVGKADRPRSPRLRRLPLVPLEPRLHESSPRSGIEGTIGSFSRSSTPSSI